MKSLSHVPRGITAQGDAIWRNNMTALSKLPDNMSDQHKRGFNTLKTDNAYLR